MPMIDLPRELSHLILNKLPMKSLLRLRCVCKLFRSMIDDPNFVKLHHSRSLACPESSTRILFYSAYAPKEIDFFSVEIGGDQQAVHCATFPADYLISFSFQKSSDLLNKSNGEMNLRYSPGISMTSIHIFPQVVKGLILLKDRIWNPLTGCLTTLPPAEDDLPDGQPVDRFLGFDPHTNQYKVLYIRHDDDFDEGKEGVWTVCKILTIGIDGIIGSWRFIKTYPREMRSLLSPALRGYDHDMLYLSHEDYYPSGVLAFDLHTEVFHTPSLPVDNIGPGWFVYNAFPGRTLFNDNDKFWLSDGKGGWDPKLDLPRPFYVLDTLGNGELLCCDDDDDRIFVGISLETEFVREIPIPDFQGSLSTDIVTHIECLIRF